MYSKSALQVIFVGAHPDDIEVGAGGTVAKLVQNGVRVYFVIMSQDSETALAQRRQGEALTAARFLGVSHEDVIFMGLTDGDIRCDGGVVAHFRMELLRRAIEPDAVFTHTIHDCHQDHRETLSVVLAAFRKKTIFSFPVANSLIVSHFVPTVFSAIDYLGEIKEKALSAHESQNSRGRLDWGAYSALEAAFGARSNCRRAEGFEVTRQFGASNCSDVHRFLESGNTNCLTPEARGGGHEPPER